MGSLTATPSSAPEPGLTADPEASVAGLAAIVLSGESAALEARLRARPVPCRNSQPPFPTCAAGQAEGTEVARVAFVGCEPSYLPLDEASRLLAQILLARSPSLHAAVEALDYDTTQAFPTGPYALVFETQPPVAGAEPTAVMLVATADGGVVSFRTGCRATPERLTESVPGGRPLEIEPGQP